MRRSVPAFGVTGRRPLEEMRAEYQARHTVQQDESAVGKLVEIGCVVKLRTRAGSNALSVELGIHGVCSGLAGMKLAPDRGEAVVVLAAAECTRAVSGRKRSRLVEEEELGESTWLQKRTTLPAAELEPTGDPALPGVTPPNTPGRVVQATPVSVYKAAGGICDKVAERRDAVLQRHLGVNVSALRYVGSGPPA